MNELFKVLSKLPLPAFRVAVFALMLVLYEQNKDFKALFWRKISETNDRLETLGVKFERLDEWKGNVDEMRRDHEKRLRPLERAAGWHSKRSELDPSPSLDTRDNQSTSRPKWENQP